ncbi:hypothetical protein [Streptomyces sp. NPDC096030]|uniref:hypothetical protein n=1 Tax=Streptomyces sp. NPDC096030 TaxID=3155423 RepID=UPI003320B888
MSTTVSVGVVSDDPAPRPAPTRLATTPLTELLAEANATIVTAVKRYPNFDGQTLQLHAGQYVIVLPKGRSVRSREVMARELVGRLLGGVQ